MGSLTIRNLPDDVHKQLKQLALQNNRSAEAEARNILSSALSREFGGGFGQVIRDIWRENVGGDFDPQRAEDGPRKVSFE